MNSLRRLLTPALAAAFSVCPYLGHAQTDLEKKLDAQFSRTKATADRTDIVTAGSVLVLQKDSLLMDTTTSNSPVSNTYQNGKIAHGVGDVLKSSVFKHFNPYQGHNLDTRSFVTGEKFWVTKITVQEDGVVFELFSDPVLNVRYYADLKFPFAKGSPPAADKMMDTIGEVLKVQPADDSAGDDKAASSDKGAPAAGAAASSPAASGSAPAGAASPTPGAAMAPIAPPPPPADAPPAQAPTVAIGQTKDQVVAILGPPKRIANLGAKEIDFYPDMKITFVKGKVSNVE